MLPIKNRTEGELFDKTHHLSLRTLKGKSESSIAATCWYSEILAFEKQFMMVYLETFPIPYPTMRKWGRGLLFSVAFISLRTANILYLVFRELITPSSTGCNLQVIFGSKNTRFTYFNLLTGRCARQV